jgi:hypothetical protein
MIPDTSPASLAALDLQQHDVVIGSGDPPIYQALPYIGSVNQIESSDFTPRDMNRLRRKITSL